MSRRISPLRRRAKGFAIIVAPPSTSAFGGLAAGVASPLVNLRAASLHFSGIILFFIKCIVSKGQPEGFQRAIGKPFGRAHRRETFALGKAIGLSKNSISTVIMSLSEVYSDTIRPTTQQSPERRCSGDCSSLTVCRYASGFSSSSGPSCPSLSSGSLVTRADSTRWSSIFST